MNINIKDPSQILSHVLLSDRKLVNKVRASDAWTALGKLKATLLINGQEVSAESLEATLQNLFGNIERHYAEKYNADNFDKAVEDKAKLLLKEHADNALEVLGNLTDKLQDYDELLKPHWER